MTDHQAVIGEAYLQHLTDDDLELLGRQRPGDRPMAPPEIRRNPGVVDDLLGRPGTVASVLSPMVDVQRVCPVSPFLVFAVAVRATTDELQTSSHVNEWLGPRRRAPVFDAVRLHEFLAEPSHRFFLTELLASYTRVVSGSVIVPTSRGIRRRRFSELDPVRFAGLLDVVPEVERPGIYRRLGDLALFLTGVFPDHTATRGFSSVEEARLLRAGRLWPGSKGPPTNIGFGDPGAVDLLDRLGRRWYQLAHDLARPPTPATAVVGELAERFGDARRVLNAITDRHLFPFRSQWFGIGS